MESNILESIGGVEYQLKPGSVIAVKITEDNVERIKRRVEALPDITEFSVSGSGSISVYQGVEETCTGKIGDYLTQVAPNSFYLHTEEFLHDAYTLVPTVGAQ